MTKARSVVVDGRYHRCHGSDMLFLLPTMTRGEYATCPQCATWVGSGRDWSMTRLAAMAMAMLLLMPFAYTAPLLDIRLLGVAINTSLFEGIWQMTKQGHPVTASIVAFCTVGVPVTLMASLLYLFFAPRIGMNLRPILLLEKLKAWMMLDIYLVGLAVAAIKIREFSDIQLGHGMVAYLTLTLLSLLTLIHLNPDQLWLRFYPQLHPVINAERYRLCLACHFTSAPDARGRCPRCHTPLRARRRHSLQKSWAALISAMVFLVPANWLPISILYVNGARKEDTILSGIISLAHGNVPVAAVVFIASILVPFTKVVVLSALLLSIQLRIQRGIMTRMLPLRAMIWIGRWSMLDLFVIALMMSLVHRDQLLAFTLGPAAFYFGAAVILTILATEWLDSRLIWDTHGTRFSNTRVNTNRDQA
ncbi:MAG: membrane integrity lipid transport subunit YebS [Symbiopectobacterium sp.]|uniref:membrane integrity lipid transport subunit YebS n=1 Tax=Symbiopectobacterium sp. TaxID=2952789 RepID=UPI0039EBCCC8